VLNQNNANENVHFHAGDNFLNQEQQPSDFQICSRDLVPNKPETNRFAIISKGFTPIKYITPCEKTLQHQHDDRFSSKKARQGLCK
jgi:hypothetical protein